METTAAEQDVPFAALRARIAAEHARLDERDAETARMEQAFWARLYGEAGRPAGDAAPVTETSSVVPQPR